MEKYENEISLAKFLTRYVLLVGEDLKKLTHEDVKVIFPDLKRCTFEMIRQNPLLVYNGNVLLVNDGHKTIPYYVPKIMDLSDDYTDFVMDEDEKENFKCKSYDYASMSNYELKLLLRNKFNSYKNRKNARKELEDRGIVMQKKHKKEKRYRYKEDYNEEY